MAADSSGLQQAVGENSPQNEEISRNRGGLDEQNPL